MNENEQLRENLRQVLAYCDELGYELGFAGVEAKQALEYRDKQAQPVAFYGLGSQLYGMDGYPVKFPLGTQFYTHPARPVQLLPKASAISISGNSPDRKSVVVHFERPVTDGELFSLYESLTGIKADPIQIPMKDTGFGQYAEFVKQTPAQPVQTAVAQEPVATKLETQQFNCFHVSAEDFERLKALPVGAKLYTAPPAAAINEQLLDALIIAGGSIMEICKERDVPIPHSTMRRIDAAINQAKSVKKGV